jgi:excisionase family DNA binding protein
MKIDQLQGQRLLDVKAAGRYLGVAAWTVREMCWRGDLKFCRVGRLVRLDIRDLDAWIEASKVQIGERFNGQTSTKMVRGCI